MITQSADSKLAARLRQLCLQVMSSVFTNNDDVNSREAFVLMTRGEGGAMLIVPYHYGT